MLSPHFKLLFQTEGERSETVVAASAKNSVACLLIGFFPLLICSGLAAQEAKEKALVICSDLAAQEIKEKAMFQIESPESVSEGVQQVTNGIPAPPADWPATNILRHITNGGCTTTAVGNRVFLTAAHCIENNDVGTVKLQPKFSASAKCERHPLFDKSKKPPAASNETKDFALCIVCDKTLAGFPFERVGASIADARKGTQVHLLGYGCTRRRGVDRGFGVLFTGTATISRIPASGDDIDYIATGENSACYGDSGGAAYAEPDANGRRSIIAVNSRTNLSDTTALSSTATEVFVDWALTWSEKYKAEICGLHGRAEGCR